MVRDRNGRPFAYGGAVGGRGSCRAIRSHSTLRTARPPDDSAETVTHPLDDASVVRAAEYLSLDDKSLIEQCDVDCFRAPGPGGQKRNKTSSAVRLRHRPTGMSAAANEDRSQHVNKRRAVRRLRAAMAFGMREEISLDADHPGEPLASCISTTAKPTLKVGRRDARYYLAVTELLDVYHACAASVADTAERLGISTANLVKFLQNDPKLWERVNQMRQSAGLKQLR